MGLILNVFSSRHPYFSTLMRTGRATARVRRRFILRRGRDFARALPSRLLLPFWLVERLRQRLVRGRLLLSVGRVINAATRVPARLHVSADQSDRHTAAVLERRLLSVHGSDEWRVVPGWPVLRRGRFDGADRCVRVGLLLSARLGGRHAESVSIGLVLSGGQCERDAVSA